MQICYNSTQRPGINWLMMNMIWSSKKHNLCVRLFHQKQPNILRHFHFCIIYHYDYRCRLQSASHIHDQHVQVQVQAQETLYKYFGTRTMKLYGGIFSFSDIQQVARCSRVHLHSSTKTIYNFAWIRLPSRTRSERYPSLLVSYLPMAFCLSKCWLPTKYSLTGYSASYGILSNPCIGSLGSIYVHVGWQNRLNPITYQSL